MSVLVEISCLFLLVVANGYLSMSEMAIVVAKKAHLRIRAKDGDKKAEAALALATSPGEFLAAIQLGITGIGILAGVFSGATLTAELALWLSRIDYIAAYAKAIAIALIVFLITVATLVIGELVPKRLALSRPEQIARDTANSVQALRAICRPAIALVDYLTNTILRILNWKKSTDSMVTEAEVEELIAEGRRSGVFHRAEQEMISGILRLDQILVGALMTPGTDIEWLDTGNSDDQILDQICSSHHERFPLADSNLDHFSGMINARDVLSQWLKTRTLDLTICMYTPHTVPENKTALDLLDDFRSSGIHAALVLDEYGAVKGMVTVSDILALVVGQLREPGEDLRWEAIKCDDNSWLIDALMPVSEFRRLFALSETANSWYQTAGGLVLNNLRHIPKEGEYFELDGFKIEVIDMDGNRIDKLLVRPLKMQD